MSAALHTAAGGPPLPAPPHPGLAPPAGPAPATGLRTIRSKNVRRAILGGLLLLVLVGAVSIFFYWRGLPAAPAYRTALVVRADITEHVTATGTLQPVITSPVGATVSGIVWKLHADFNSEVKKGQLLVELDPALFENAVAMATAQLASVTANLTGAQAAALGARLVRDRTMTLESKSLVSDADVDASVAVFAQAKGVARSTVAQIALARAQLDRARLDLEHSIIRSPVDGTVISRNVDVGQAVASSLTAPTLFTIAQDLHQMQVHAAVDEADIGDVHAGQTATFTVDAFRAQEFKAVVREVRNAPQTAQNVVTYDVVLDVENPDGKLRPGMTATVLVLISQKLQVPAVPNEALRFRPPAAPGAPPRPPAAGAATVQQSAAVYIPAGAAAVRLPIEAGVTDGTLTEAPGLEPGREVIIDIARGKKGKAGRAATAAAPTGGGRGL